MFHTISGIEKICGGEGGGEVPGFCVEIDLSHSAEKICRGTLLCFTDFPVSRKFTEKSGGGGYQDFPSKIFCVTVPKVFVGDSFGFSLISGNEKG